MFLNNLNLSSSEYIITLILVFIAYLASITINGVIQTWVADTMGDDTPKREGYGSWNPLVHIDPIGLIAIFVFRLGWGKFLPFNVDKIYKKNFSLRLILIYLTEPLVAFFLGLSTFIALISFVDPSALQYIANIIFLHNIPLSIIKHALKDYSSISILGILLLVSFVILNAFMAALSLIFNGVRFFLTMAVNRNGDIAQYTDVILMVGPLIIIWFFADPLRLFVLKLIWQGASLFSQFTGV